MGWEDLIKSNVAILTDPKKKIWDPDELAIVYEIVNLHDGTNEVDTGCGMCRRSKVQRVRKIVETYIKTNL
jgi:hypothetical protein